MEFICKIFLILSVKVKFLYGYTILNKLTNKIYYKLSFSITVSLTFCFKLCYMCESDTLLLCTFEKGGSKNTYSAWLIALSRLGSEWRDGTRVKIDDNKAFKCFFLRDSQVLLGCNYSANMAPFSVTVGAHWARPPHSSAWKVSYCLSLSNTF